jgi:hypothetical protein
MRIGWVNVCAEESNVAWTVDLLRRLNDLTILNLNLFQPMYR